MDSIKEWYKHKIKTQFKNALNQFHVSIEEFPEVILNNSYDNFIKRYFTKAYEINNEVLDDREKIPTTGSITELVFAVNDYLNHKSANYNV